MMNIISVILWIPAILIRWVLIAFGLFIVPFSLVADGSKQTPRLWKFWVDVETKPEWWAEDDVEWWMYLYLPLMATAAYWSYSHWHELITIWLIFCTLGAVLTVWSKDRWMKFWWFAIRNPTIGLARKFPQPVPEDRPNPDEVVRTPMAKSAHRWMRHGWQSEYWYLRAVGKKYFEVRVGWKYVDGNEEFFPTFQLRLGG